MREGLWACATVGRAHGLRGEVYLDLLPGGLTYLEKATSFVLSREGAEELLPVRVERAGGSDRRPLVRLSGVNTREEARALYGALVCARGAELDAGDHYVVGDLLGARVVSGGRELGVVSDVLISPAHEIIEITSPDARVTLVPFVAELVEVDVESGVVTIREGLL